MKIRSCVALIGFIAMVITAASIDLTELTVNKHNRENVSLTTEQIALQPCDKAQTNFAGPLVPEAGSANSGDNLSEIEAGGRIPTEAWSNRAGFSISTATEAEYWAGMLGSGWYLDWSIIKDPPNNNLEYWSMVRVNEDCISPSVEMIEAAATQYPGQVWIIGNEPDVIWQDNVTPKTYAAVYHELYKLIKRANPTALIAVGGISQATRLRLEYLDQVLQNYQDNFHEAMPVDWWTLHGYVLREEKGSWGVDIPPGIDTNKGELREVSDHGRTDLFEDQIKRFRQWMAKNGYQNTPLALTEFGILMPESYGFPSEMIEDYLRQTFTWLYGTADIGVGYPLDEYRLVQKWAWFSISDPIYPASNLGDLDSGKLTRVGERFRQTIPLLILEGQ